MHVAWNSVSSLVKCELNDFWSCTQIHEVQFVTRSRNCSECKLYCLAKSQESCESSVNEG